MVRGELSEIRALLWPSGSQGIKLRLSGLVTNAFTCWSHLIHPVLLYFRYKWCAYVCGTCVAIRGQLVDVNSLLSPCGYQGSNSAHHARQAASGFTCQVISLVHRSQFLKIIYFPLLPKCTCDKTYSPRTITVCKGPYHLSHILTNLLWLKVLLSINDNIRKYVV